ncbi:hypothetical protein ISF_03954 [Cordyceps fumosorosea ARSEF 2679]|uniref:Uncharacterized protein n=1 Tax=Cordyceps fumosorosea (strain ARSEF 2679) TaxID=1081104 RepID=A0A167YBH4_CORFA|nr:hypothetical protein ISF_03954 [Cordyceps fumosorosea ARSEF 2679]OAA66116.1 hypothetical protein ISF_03954 [Cordyceps fumosorosea ARSEF 2679]
MEYVTVTINPRAAPKTTEPSGPFTSSHHGSKKRLHQAPPARATAAPASEDRLLEGLAVLLDYLNDGDGPDQLARLRRRADLWCQAYHRRRDYTLRDPRRGRPISRVPRCVFAAHPHLFSPTRRPPPTRLDPSSPPPLEPDGGDSSDPEAGVFDDDDDDRPEEFPAYAEPALLCDDDALRRLAERCDRDREPLERRRRARLLDAAGGHHHAALFDVRVHARDLLDSPILWYIPELVACLAHLPPAPAYVSWLREQQRPVLADEEEAAWEEAEGVVTDATMSVPIGLKRKVSGKGRHESHEWRPKAEGGHRKGRGWNILAMMG